MSGMFESWLHKLVSALQTREKEANVVVVDWLPLAHQLYIDAVSNTRVVGRRVAGMLNWLQVSGDEREAPPTTFFLRKQSTCCYCELRGRLKSLALQFAK